MEQMLERHKYEVETFQKLDHPYIMKVKDVFEDNLFYIYTQYTDEQEKYDSMFSLHAARRMAYNLLSALNHCHE